MTTPDERAAIDSLRRADGPIAPDADFADRLFDDLATAVRAATNDADADRAKRPAIDEDLDPWPSVVANRPSRRVLAAAAAMLIFAGLAVAVGRADQDEPEVVEIAVPSADLDSACADRLPAVEPSLEALDDLRSAGVVSTDALEVAVARLEDFTVVASDAAVGLDERIASGLARATRALRSARDSLGAGTPAAVGVAEDQLNVSRNLVRASLRMAVSEGATECRTESI